MSQSLDCEDLEVGTALVITTITITTGRITDSATLRCQGAVPTPHLVETTGQKLLQRRQ